MDRRGRVEAQAMGHATNGFNELGIGVYGLGPNKTGLAQQEQVLAGPLLPTWVQLNPSVNQVFDSLLDGLGSHRQDECDDLHTVGMVAPIPLVELRPPSLGLACGQLASEDRRECSPTHTSLPAVGQYTPSRLLGEEIEWETVFNTD